MPLTIADITENGVLGELATVFNSPTNSTILLNTIRFPNPFPPFNNDPLTFWLQVCQAIDAGRIAGGFEQLLGAVLDQYPGNRIFNQARPNANAPAIAEVPANDSVNIVISGWNNPLDLLAVARRLAQTLDFTEDSVSLGFANAEGVLLNLVGWNTEQAIGLEQAIEAEATANNLDIDTTVGASEFRDYLLSRLYIEGPDQARYEINDIRASTTVGEVAKVVMNEFYDKEIYGTDKHGKSRQVVVDRQNEDGTSQRLESNETLHDQSIQEGDVLSVAPEATAGGINPNDWKEAIVRVKNGILKYQNSHPGFVVSVNRANLPTEYVFKFSAPSYGKPPSKGEAPVLVNNHEVFMVMPADFPMGPPRTFWQTNIYHPNIHPENGYVCMGDLADQWTPGTDFYEICQQLVDIAKFENYSLYECFNQDALNWVRSPEGVAAIHKIGGQDLIKKIYQQVAKPRRLSIRKL